MKKLFLILISSGLLRASLDGWLFVWPAQYGYSPNIPYARFCLRNDLPQGLTARGAALRVCSKPGWLLGPEIGNWFYDQDIPNGETRGVGTPESWGAVSGTGYGTTGSLIMRPFIRNGELPYDERMVISVLVGPPPPILTTEALDGKHIRLLCSYQDDCYDKHYVFWKNEKDKSFQQIQISGDPTQYTLQVPYSSTEYQIYAGGTWNSGVPGAPPYEGFSETTTDTTFPHLSSRDWDFFSGPAQNKVIYDHENHRLYLVLVDQGKVWLLRGEKDPGKGIAWDEREYLLSDLLPRAWDPCIGLLETTLPWDTMLFCAFAGRIPRSPRPQNPWFWPHDPDIYIPWGFPFYPLSDKGYRGPIS